ALEGLRPRQERLEPGDLVAPNHTAEIHRVKIQLLLALRDCVAGAAVRPGGVQFPACRLKQRAALLPESALGAFIRPAGIKLILTANAEVCALVFHAYFTSL